MYHDTAQCLLFVTLSVPLCDSPKGELSPTSTPTPIHTVSVPPRDPPQVTLRECITTNSISIQMTLSVCPPAGQPEDFSDRFIPESLNMLTIQWLYYWMLSQGAEYD